MFSCDLFTDGMYVTQIQMFIHRPVGFVVSQSIDDGMSTVSSSNRHLCITPTWTASPSSLVGMQSVMPRPTQGLATYQFLSGVSLCVKGAKTATLARVLQCPAVPRAVLTGSSALMICMISIRKQGRASLRNCFFFKLPTSWDWYMPAVLCFSSQIYVRVRSRELSHKCYGRAA